LKEITNYYVWIPASVVGTLPAPRFMVCFTWLIILLDVQLLGWHIKAHLIRIDVGIKYLINCCICV
jgi:hypothetical protein